MTQQITHSIILYQSEDGEAHLEVQLIDDTVWLNQAQVAELLGKDKRIISEHIRNIFSEGELQEQAVVRKFRTTGSDGKNYDVIHNAVCP